MRTKGCGLGKLLGLALAVLPGLSATLGADWHPQWMRELPPRKPAWEYTPRMLRDAAYEPVILGGLVLVGCEHNGALLALDAATGQERWRFHANGPIRFAPATDSERIYLVADDGCLYCLDLAGRLLWKCRGGPSERKVIGHERLISVWPASARPVLHDGKVFFVAGYWPIEGIFVYALDARTGAQAWANDAARFRPFGELRVVGKTLFIYGHHGSGAFDVATGTPTRDKPPRPEPPPALPDPPGVQGKVAAKAMAGGRLVVSTTQGRIYCFAEAEAKARIHKPSPPAGAPDAALADAVLAASGTTEGYCLVLGLKDGALVEGLVRRSKLHVIAIDPDESKVEAVRRRLDDRGLFATRRLAVHVGEPGTFGLPPYIASLIVSETSLPAAEVTSRLLRPYGGTRAERAGGKLKLTRRNGPLPGSADWTHEFADETNCLCTRDKLVKAPLGFLWYGGPAADTRFYFDGKVDHQSGDGVSPLPPNAEIVDGRMILQGPGLLGAFDIYTGRQLWEVPIPKVYGFGGRGGGVGIHSKKHREPWKYPEALKMEVPSTHHSRTTGFNYVSVPDGIYVAAGRKCLRLNPADGKLVSQWPVPLEGGLCWGNLRVSGDLLVATAFRPQDLVDAQAGHDGNGGDWSKDRMPMPFLFVVDRTSGKLLWSRPAAWGFLNQGTAVGGGKVFCVDLVTEGVMEKLRGAGRRFPSVPPMLYALDVKTGAEAWKFQTDVLVKQLTYSKERDILIAPARTLVEWKDGAWHGPGRVRRGKATGKMRGFRGADGQLIWEVAEAPYFEPHVVLGDLIIDRYCWPYDLLTGKRHQRMSPVTGRKEVWNFRKGGCNHLVACDGVVTWRTAFYELAGHSGVMRLHGQDAGCSPTFLPAGGVLNAANFGTHHKRNRSTALALIHVPDAELWTTYAASRETEAAPVRRIGYNFGAPGDRLAPDGTLWFAVAGRRSADCALQPGTVNWFQLHHSRTGSWIASSGVTGLSELRLPTVFSRGRRGRPSGGEARRYTVRLVFAEPQRLKPGERVFTVAIEGKPVLVDFDIVKEAGGPLRPIVREAKGVEAKAEVTLTFGPRSGQPLVCGVELEAQ